MQGTRNRSQKAPSFIGVSNQLFHRSRGLGALLPSGPGTESARPACRRSVLRSSSCLERKPLGAPQLVETPETPPSSRAEGLLFLHGLESNPGLEWTGWISLQSKGLSRVFSNTTVQKHQFFVSTFLPSHPGKLRKPAHQDGPADTGLDGPPS